MSEEARFGEPRVLIPFVLITLIWSSTWLVIKGQLGMVPPPWSVTYRFLIGAAAMFAVARSRGAPLAMPVRMHAAALLIGTMQFVLNFNFVYAAEQTITSGVVAVVFALLVAPNALFAWIVFKRRVSPGFVAGSLVAFAGVALLFVQELRTAAAGPAAVLGGIGLTFAGVLSASCSNVMQLAEAVRRQPVASLVAWAMLYGALVDGAVAFALWGAPVFDTRGEYWAGIFYLGLLASALAFTLYFSVIRAIGPAKAAYSSVLVPILAMALSTMFEGYRWTGLSIGGGLLAIAGLLIALRSPPDRAAAPAPLD